MLQTKDTSPETILQRIDAMIAELQSLRQAVTTLQKQSASPSQNIVDELFGLLGPGSWDGI
jgi:hypothetical protein